MQVRGCCSLAVLFWHRWDCHFWHGSWFPKQTTVVYCWLGMLFVDRCIFFPSRSGPAESMEYLTGPRVIYKERDLPYYQGGQPTVLLSKGNYSRAQDMRVAELRYPQYYQPQPLTTQHKGPLRQDVPPSPPQSHRAPAYNEMGRARHRGTSPDQYQYRPQDPRQKNPMTAAV